MTDADRRTLEANLKRPLDDLMEELEAYDPASRSRADTWRKVRDPLYQRLCVEWDWCSVRQDARWDDDVDLGLVVLGVLSARTLHLPFDPDLVLIAAIVVKRGLDAFCDCF